VNRSLILDTNVLVSAALHLDGPPGLLVQAVLKRELACFACPAIVEEYWDVLTRPKFARLGFPPAWFQPLLKEARHLAADPPPWPLAGPDPDDLVFLAQAKQTGAVLVTGNLADFPETIRKAVHVMAPRAYLDALP
jgi:predicted nucleic acid-binding protein